jgi:predicted RNase H-like nuclease (RuvC/YqgF family)
MKDSANQTRSPFNQIFGDGNDSKEAKKASTQEPEIAAVSPQGESWGESIERAATKRNSDSTPPPQKGAERIDAVRELLFGDQISELKDAILTLEDRLAARISKMEREAQTAIENSERKLKEEMESLRQDMRRESDKREELSDQVTKRLDSTALDLSGKVSSLGDELRRRIDEETGDIRDRFARKDNLGGLLAELGQRLKGDAKA